MTEQGTPRFACPCCGYLTLDARPPGTFDICEVCRWEDDNVQFRDPGYEGGANVVSLNDARRNFEAHGVSEIRFADDVRPPRPEEQP
ncbi:MAG: CPCC family cysteine-rich protein [Solirubrobacteraceae bacterium]